MAFHHRCAKHCAPGLELFGPRPYELLKARPIKLLMTQHRALRLSTNESRVRPLYFMKAAVLLLGLFGLCCAFDTIEQAVKQFNDESHLLFIDPKAGKGLLPREKLRVFTKDNVVVPELKLEDDDEIIIRSLEDALEDFRTNYSEKRDREWKRVIAARKELVASAGDAVEEKQEAFLKETVDLISQHYERTAREAEAVAIVFQEDLLDVPGASLEERLPSERKHKYNIKTLSGKFETLKGLLGLEGDVVPLQEISKSTFDKVIELSSENQELGYEPLSAETVAEILVAADYLLISGEAAPTFYRNIIRLMFVPSIKNPIIPLKKSNFSLRSLKSYLGLFSDGSWSSRLAPGVPGKNTEDFLEGIDAFLDFNDISISEASYRQLLRGLLDQLGLEIRVSGRDGTICRKNSSNDYGNLDEIGLLEQVTLLPSALVQIPRNQHESSRLAVLIWLFKHLGISSLALRNCLIDSKDIDCIASMNLQKLNLSGCKLVSKDLAKLLASEKMRNITTLDLSGNNFGDGDAKAIAKKLVNLPNLRNLNLGSCKIKKEGTKHIAEHLGNLKNLTTLNLARNEIGPAGAEHIASHLKDVQSLTTLNLGVNEIGPACAGHIANHLKDVQSLTTLNLGSNWIGDQGAEHIANHLKDVQSLTTLDLSGNEIGPEGAEHIANHLNHVQSLTTLNLLGNEIGPVGAELIANHLKDARSLVTFNLGVNKIGYEKSKEIKRKLAHVPNLTI